VARLPPGLQLADHLRVDGRLRVDEALKIERIVLAHARSLLPSSPLRRSAHSGPRECITRGDVSVGWGSDLREELTAFGEPWV